MGFFKCVDVWGVCVGNKVRGQQSQSIKFQGTRPRASGYIASFQSFLLFSLDQCTHLVIDELQLVQFINQQRQSFQKDSQSANE